MFALSACFLTALLLIPFPGGFPSVRAQTLTAVSGSEGEDERRADLALAAFVQGAAYESEEDYIRAMISFRSALAMDGNVAIHLAIARTAEALHDEITAVHHLQCALKQRPEDARLLRKLGEVYSTCQQADSAAFVLERLREIEGESESLLQALGSLYASRRDFDRAAAVYDSLRLRFPARPMYALMLAEMEMNRGGWDRASELMLPLSADSSIGHEDRIQIGKLFFQRVLKERRDIDQAIAVFTNLRRDFPDDWRPLWFRGAVLYNAGSTADAITDFEEVMRLSPGNTEAGQILSRAYAAAGRFDDAITVLRTLLAVREGSGAPTALIHEQLGDLYRALERTTEARAHYDEALRQEPGNQLVRQKLDTLNP